MVESEVENRVSIKSWDLHVKSEFELCLGVWVVDLEETVNELFKIDVAAWVEIKHREEALTNDTWELTVLWEAT